MTLTPLDKGRVLRADGAMLIARNRSFGLLFSASAITNLGDGVSALAFPWLATLITRDPFLIGAVAFATRLPWLLFAVPAGETVRSNEAPLRTCCLGVIHGEPGSV